MDKLRETVGLWAGVLLGVGLWTALLWRVAEKLVGGLL